VTLDKIITKNLATHCGNNIDGKIAVGKANDLELGKTHALSLFSITFTC
jgi:hypothetical protein